MTDTSTSQYTPRGTNTIEPGIYAIRNARHQTHVMLECGNDLVAGSLVVGKPPPPEVRLRGPSVTSLLAEFDHLPQALWVITRYTNGSCTIKSVCDESDFVGSGVYSPAGTTVVLQSKCAYWAIKEAQVNQYVYVQV